MTDDDTYALLNLGLALYRANEPFEAHEIWEHAWMGEVGRAKLTLQALIQIAAAQHKHQEGNRRGPSKLLAKALDKVGEIRSGCSAWLGLDMVDLEDQIRRALAQADAFARGERETIEPVQLPPVSGRDGVIYLHGFASSPQSHKASVIVPPLQAAGFRVAVPDLNEDAFFDLTAGRALALAKRHMRERTLVIGSSFGGYLAALLAARDERVKGLVLMAPAFDLAETMRARHGVEGVARWKAQGWVQTMHHAYGGLHRIGYGFMEDLEQRPAFPPIRVPTTIVHGRQDEVVPCEHSMAMAARYPHHVDLALVDDDHGLAESAAMARDAAVAHAQRIGLEPEPPPCTPQQARDWLLEREQAAAENPGD